MKISLRLCGFQTPFHCTVLPNYFQLLPDTPCCFAIVNLHTRCHSGDALPCIALPCVALHHVASRCVALQCISLHCVALNCIALCCVALRCIVLHWIALQCIMLHCVALHFFGIVLGWKADSKDRLLLGGFLATRNTSKMLVVFAVLFNYFFNMCICLTF